MSGPTESTKTKPRDAAAITSAPAVRKPRRPKRSTAAPIRGRRMTAATPCIAVTYPICSGLAVSARTRYFGSRKKLEKA